MSIQFQWRDKIDAGYWRDLLEGWREALVTWFTTVRDIDWRNIDWREELKPAKLRVTINRHAKGISIAASVLIFVLMIISFWSFFHQPVTPVKSVSYAYFIDEETGKETYESITEIPPLKGYSGKSTLVRIIYYSCDGCKTRTAAYYEKYTPEAKSLLEQNQGKPLDQMTFSQVQDGHMVRSPASGSPWVKANSPEGMQARQIMPCSNGGGITYCTP